MARWEGVEPPTSWFVAKRSIQLSYQRAKKAYYHDASVPRQLGILLYRFLLKKNLMQVILQLLHRRLAFCNK